MVLDKVLMFSPSMKPLQHKAPLIGTNYSLELFLCNVIGTLSIRKIRSQEYVLHDSLFFEDAGACLKFNIMT